MGKPAPFSRPSIALSTGTAPRSWQDVPAQNLDFGDMVPDHGYVTEKLSYSDLSEGLDKVGFTFTSGKRAIFNFDEIVRAFTSGNRG